MLLFCNTRRFLLTALSVLQHRVGLGQNRGRAGRAQGVWRNFAGAGARRDRACRVGAARCHTRRAAAGASLRQRDRARRFRRAAHLWAHRRRYRLWHRLCPCRGRFFDLAGRAGDGARANGRDRRGGRGEGRLHAPPARRAGNGGARLHEAARRCARAARRLCLRPQSLCRNASRRGAAEEAVPGQRAGRGDWLRVAIAVLLRARSGARRAGGGQAAARGERRADARCRRSQGAAAGGTGQSERLQRLRRRTVAIGRRLHPAGFQFTSAVARAGRLVRTGGAFRPGLGFRRRDLPRRALSAARPQSHARVDQHGQPARSGRYLQAHARQGGHALSV